MLFKKHKEPPTDYNRIKQLTYGTQWSSIYLSNNQERERENLIYLLRGKMKDLGINLSRNVQILHEEHFDTLLVSKEYCIGHKDTQTSRRQQKE